MSSTLGEKNNKKNKWEQNPFRAKPSVYYTYFRLVFHFSVPQSEQESWGGKTEKVWGEKRGRQIAHSSIMWQQIITGTTEIDQQSASNWYRQTLFFSSFLSTLSPLTLRPPWCQECSLIPCGILSMVVASIYRREI